MSITKEYYGRTPEGEEVSIFSLENRNSMKVQILDYGAVISSILVEDRYGQIEDVVLGFDTLEDYMENVPFFGATIGRCANRIEGGEVVLENTAYKLDRNEGSNTLHSGRYGYHKRVWKSSIVEGNPMKLVLSLYSTDKDQGFPGNLEISIEFSLTDENELIIKYDAVSDKTTVINLTNHSYFNLKGHDKGTILSHQLMIEADYFTPIRDLKSIPTGEILSVEGTPMDFRNFKEIGEEIDSDYPQIRFGTGYDHNWVFVKPADEFKKVVTLTEPETGRMMEVLTDMPGVQFYSGNFLDGTFLGKANTPYSKWNGLCLETQYFPDAVHHERFVSPVYAPGEHFQKKTVYKFSVQS